MEVNICTLQAVSHHGRKPLRLSDWCRGEIHILTNDGLSNIIGLLFPGYYWCYRWIDG